MGVRISCDIFERKADLALFAESAISICLTSDSDMVSRLLERRPTSSLLSTVIFSL